MMLMAKLRLLSNTLITLALDMAVGDKTAGEDFALGFWQKSSSIFLKFIFKFGGFADDQTDLSKTFIFTKKLKWLINVYGKIKS